MLHLALETGLPQAWPSRWAAVAVRVMHSVRALALPAPALVALAGQPVLDYPALEQEPGRSSEQEPGRSWEREPGLYWAREPVPSWMKAPGRAAQAPLRPTPAHRRHCPSQSHLCWAPSPRHCWRSGSPEQQ